MSGITAGALRVSGGIGIGSIVSFFMCEYPGEHSRATITHSLGKTDRQAVKEIWQMPLWKCWQRGKNCLCTAESSNP